jgi:hypothetical protein
MSLLGRATVVVNGGVVRLRAKAAEGATVDHRQADTLDWPLTSGTWLVFAHTPTRPVAWSRQVCRASFKQCEVKALGFRCWWVQLHARATSYTALIGLRGL